MSRGVVSLEEVHSVLEMLVQLYQLTKAWVNWWSDGWR